MASLRTAEDCFIDFCGRRRGILRALTTEVEKFFADCSPEKENLCLYGYADGAWEVALPCEEVPPELPEPALGINFARDGMRRMDWLCLVAVHSDSWLMSIAFYNAARLDQQGRRQLFDNINSLPTLYELVSGRVSATAPVATVAAPTAKRAGGSPAMAAGPGAGAERRQPPSKRQRPGGPRARAMQDDAEGLEEGSEDDDEEEGNSDPCPNCGRQYRSGEFWIQCDYCDRWFDGKCVNMTEQKANKQRDWRCPLCSTKGP